MSTHEDRANPVAIVRGELSRMESELKAMLPGHIAPDKFNRVVLTAIQKNPQLLNMNRKSLFESCLTCAGDGLLPDGKEAALVPYKGVVQYLPMIAGIRKKVRQSGDIVSWDARIIRENDEYDIVFGDDEYIKHRPNLTSTPGKIIIVYSIAVFKSGERSREVMTIAEVEAIRRKSRAQNGPWQDDAFYPEMVRKTVLRRHAKSLPLSPEVEAVMQRDDVLYDLTPEPAPQITAKPRPSLEDFASEPEARAPLGGGQRAPAPPASSLAGAREHPAEPLRDARASGAAGRAPPDSPSKSPDAPPSFDAEAETDTGPPLDPLNAAYARGRADRRSGKSIRAVPPEYRTPECNAEAGEWRSGWTDEDKDGEWRSGWTDEDKERIPQ